MYQINYHFKWKQKLFGSILVIGYTTTLYSIIHFYFTYTNTIFAIFMIISILVIFKMAGLFLLYPGNFGFVNADIERNRSNQLMENIHQTLITLERICNLITTNSLPELLHHYYELEGSKIMNDLKFQLRVLKKCKNKTYIKREIVKHYAELIYRISSQVLLHESNLIQIEQIQVSFRQANRQTTNQPNWISLKKIFQSPYIINRVKATFDFYTLQQSAKDVMFLSYEIWKICLSINSIPFQDIIPEIKHFQSNGTQSSFNNREVKIKNLKSNGIAVGRWQLFQPKVFNIQAFFVYWSNLFDYKRYNISIEKGYQIQTAIIYSQKRVDNQGLIHYEQSPKAVLFSNPNAAIFQEYALTSSYINFYLRWGYYIILWNYRGYGNSTGIATSANSVRDIQSVYQFYRTKSIDIRILHGYSVGGISSINLAQKLNSGNKKPIKLLIADRTFSSIDLVASSFIQNSGVIGESLKFILQRGTRLLFNSECDDLGLKFIESKCEKILIQDENDQIIKEKASLKFSLEDHFLKADRLRRAQLKESVCQLVEALLSSCRKNKFLFLKFVQIIERNVKKKVGGSQNEQELSLNQIKTSLLHIFSEIVLFGVKGGNYSLRGQEEEKNYLLKKFSTIEESIKEEQNLLEQHFAFMNQDINQILVSLNKMKKQIEVHGVMGQRKIVGNLILSKVGHNGDLSSQYNQLNHLILKLSHLEAPFRQAFRRKQIGQ